MKVKHSRTLITQPREKRRNGDGSIIQMPNGKYRIQVMIGKDEAGRIVRKSKVCETQKEALRYRDEFLKLKHRKQIVKSNGKTVKQLLEEWLKHKELTVKPLTLDTYRVQAGVIQKYLKAIKIQNLRLPKIQQMVDTMTAGYKPSTIALVINTLEQALDYAVRMGYVEVNVCNPRQLDMPRQAHTQKLIWNEEQLKKFIETAKETTYYPVYVLALHGLRCGEVLGLNCGDVNTQTGEISIHQQYLQYRGGAVMQESTKTATSTRTITVSSDVLALLISVIGDRADDEPLLVSDKGGRISRQMYRKRYIDVIQQANIPYISLHKLRHIAASLLAASGTPSVIIAKILGHANTYVTKDVYVHTQQEQIQQTSATISSLLPTDSITA